MNQQTIDFMHQFFVDICRSSGFDVTAPIAENNTINENIFIYKILTLFIFSLLQYMIYSELDKMLLLRWKMSKQSFFQQVRFNSSTYKQVKVKNTELPNPFKNKPYLEIINIMKTGIFQKNELSISKLLAEDAIIRAEQATVSRDQPTLNQVDARQKLMNIVIEKMLTRIKQLTFEEISLIIRLFNSANETRSFKISSKNKQTYKIELQNRIRNIIEQDKEGVHKQSLKKILYTLLESHKRLLIIKDVIQYLEKHDLYNNQQMLIFFEKLSPASKSGNYDGILQVFIDRFLNTQANNLENTSSWVKPIVFEFVKIYTNGIRLQGNNYLSKFLIGLQHQLKNNKMQINEEVWFFCQLLQFVLYQSPYMSKIEDIERFSKLIYDMMKDLKEKMKTDMLISIQNLEKVMQSRYLFNNFFQLSYLSLKKQYTQLSQEFEQFLEQIFKFQIVERYERFTPKDLANVVNIDIHHTPQIQQKFVKSLIKLLVKSENQGIYLITRLRVYQYIVKSIKSNNLQINLTQFEGLLRTIQKNARKLKQYEIIRIYNIFRLLGLQSPVISSIFKLYMQRKPAAITQNLSRTSLKSFSLPVVIDSLNYLKDKYYKNKAENTTNVLQVIWTSCKKTKRQFKEPNRDQILKYWICQNKEYFQDITKSYKNCYKIMANFINQINTSFRNTSGRNSINYEILLEVIKSWSDQNQNLRSQRSEQKTMIFENLKNFVQSQNVSSLLQIEYRHSFFIKIMWVQILLSQQSQSRNETYLKRLKQIRQSQIIMKFLKQNISRNRPTIKHSILRKYLKTFNFPLELKHKLYQQTLNTYLWMAYHQIQVNENKGVYFTKEFQNYVAKRAGILGLFELLVFFHRREAAGAYTDKLRDSVPNKILDGTLTRQTPVSQIELLGLLAYPQTLNYFFKKHPGLVDVFILKITDIKNPILYIKIIEAYNLVNRLKYNILPSTYGEFKKWVERTLQNYYQPQVSPQIAHLWVQTNYSTEKTRESILNYVRGQLNQGNFYFASLFYLNGYTGLSNEVKQLLQLTDSNKIVKFMQYFKEEHIQILTWFLGLSLNQQNIELIQIFTKRFIIRQFHENVLEIFKNDKDIVYQLYILLSVAKHRLSSRKQAQDAFKAIKFIQQQIQFGIQNIQNDCLEKLKQKTWKSLEKFAPNMVKNLSKHENSGFPIYKDKILLIDQEEPGYIKNVEYYISKVVELGQSIVIKQIDLIKMQSASS